MRSRYRLMTPGPTPVPEAARAVLAEPVRHHRTAEFRAVLAEAVELLQYVFCTRNDVAVLTGSGTGAMEACVAAAVGNGDKAIVLDSGKFAHRWTEIARRFGAEVISLSLPWGRAYSPEMLRDALQAHPDCRAVFATLSESSTGVGHDIEGLGKVVRESEALFVVDAISGAGCMECRTDEWGIDLLAVGGQKALAIPPGLAFVAVSPRVWERLEQRPDRPCYYFDLAMYRRAWEKHDTPYTPASSLVRALVVNLREIRDYGIENIWSRCRRLAAATRAGLTAVGFSLVAERPADGLTAVYFPAGLDGKAFLQRLEERYGIKLAGGQGPLAGKICRISHMGEVDEVDIVGVLGAIELTLIELGATIRPGQATTAALQVLASETGTQ